MKKFEKSAIYAVLIVFLSLFTSAFAATDNTLHQVKEGISDTAIITKINALYVADKKLDPFKIGIDSHHGTVTLKGKVNTDKEYEKAVAIAASVDGVNKVHAKNLIVKESRNPIKDTYTTALVKGKLLKDKLLNLKTSSAQNISVTTKNGIVHLSGHVKNTTKKEKIIKIAHSIDGVKSVNADYLKVQ